MAVRLLISVAALALACGAQGAAVPTSPPSVTSPALDGVTADSLLVTLVPDSLRVHLKQPVRLTLSVQNVSRTTQHIALTTGCTFDYEVLSPTGAVLGTADQMCTEVMGQRTLAAGETFSAVLVWIPGTAVSGATTPGTYALRGVLLRAGSPARSAPVTVQVLP